MSKSTIHKFNLMLLLHKRTENKSEKVILTFLSKNCENPFEIQIEIATDK